MPDHSCHNSGLVWCSRLLVTVHPSTPDLNKSTLSLPVCFVCILTWNLALDWSCFDTTTILAHQVVGALISTGSLIPRGMSLSKSFFTWSDQCNGTFMGVGNATGFASFSVMIGFGSPLILGSDWRVHWWAMMTNNWKWSVLSTVPSTMMDHKAVDLVVTWA